MGGNGLKLGQFRWDVRGNMSERAGECWNTLAREGLESPSLGCVKDLQMCSESD